jgi:hypothetical protein
VTTPSGKPASKRTTGTMTKPATKPPTTTATQIAAISEVSREQLASIILQGQQLRVDATQTWVDAFMGDVQAATKFTFDVAADLLSAQREFAVELTKVVLPAKSA